MAAFSSLSSLLPRRLSLVAAPIIPDLVVYTQFNAFSCGTATQLSAELL